jgi:predicted nucleic acid-binding protein
MRVLVDTSLLLPTLGIEVERAEKILEKLSNYEVYYSDFSILECLWVASSLERKGEFVQEIFDVGLESIFEGYAKAGDNAEVFIKAFELYKMGHNDLIDCILYSTALHNNMKFASLDKELKKFVRDNGLKYIFFE